MFTQSSHLRGDTHPTPSTCNGCVHECTIDTIRESNGVIYPRIGGQTIRFYFDSNNQTQIIFPSTCPSFKSAQRLGEQIATYCDNYRKCKQR